MPIKLNGATTGSVTLTAPDGGNNVTLVIPSSTSASVATSDTAYMVGSSFSPSNRNLLINGSMMCAQRGTSFSLTNSVTSYTLDRWYVNTTGGAGTVAQVSGSGEFSKAMRITGASGVNSGFFGQKIESVNCGHLVGKTVTYQIVLSSSSPMTLTWYARHPSSADNYAGVTLISSGAINVTSTPTEYTFQISNLPSGVTNGLEIYFTFGSFTSGTLDITGAQLEVGTVASQFEFENFGDTLRKCQRYYQTIGAGINGEAINATTVEINGVFNQPMRAAPVVTLLPGTVTLRHITGDFQSASPTIPNMSTTVGGFWTQMTGFSGLNTGRFVGSRNTTGYNWPIFRADAEIV